MRILDRLVAGRDERPRGCILASLPILFCMICQDFYRFSAFSAFSAFLEDPGQLGCAEGPGVAFLHLCQCFSAFFVKMSMSFLHLLHFLHFLEDPGQIGCEEG